MSGLRRRVNAGAGANAGAGGVAGAGADARARAEESNGVQHYHPTTPNPYNSYQESSDTEYDSCEEIFDTEEGVPSLRQACVNGDIVTATSLLEKCSDYEYVNSHSGDEERTPLMLASLNGHAELVRVFLKYENVSKGIKIQDVDGNTALHLAALNAKDGALRVLARKASENVINIQNNNKQTALMFATQNCRLIANKTLLNNNAKLLIVDKNSRNAMHYLTMSKQAGRHPVAELLLDSPDAKKASEQIDCSPELIDDTQFHCPVDYAKDEYLQKILNPHYIERLNTARSFDAYDTYMRRQGRRNVNSGREGAAIPRPGVCDRVTHCLSSCVRYILNIDQAPQGRGR